MLVDLKKVKEKTTTVEGLPKLALAGLRVVITDDVKVTRKALEAKHYQPIDYKAWIEELVDVTGKPKLEAARLRDLAVRGAAANNQLGNCVVLVNNKTADASAKTAIGAATVVVYWVSNNDVLAVVQNKR